MLNTYRPPRYAYRRPAELDAGAALRRHAVVVVGAGPVGLAAAIDLAQQGLQVLLLDEDDTVSEGSRGLCFAKRTLEIFDRLGCGDAVVAKGVTWNVGRTFHRSDEVFRFELQPQSGHQRPGMVNLQQYHVEQILIERAMALPNLELRWKNRVVGVAPPAPDSSDAVRLRVETPDGSYELDADWLVVADGARSPIRHLLGLDMEGRVFHDRFLIADVVMETEMFAEGQAERWFWFDPPFHPGQSVLLHRQADKVWRIDFQLGWDADPDFERDPERVSARIRAMLGPDRPFELEWISVYTFQCRRMQRFRHGRVLFAGDAAHQVSPFGARGANSGIQDADNLAWKLALVISGHAPEALLDSYDEERGLAADENLLNSTRSTDFITPKSEVSLDFRNAVLALAREHEFARWLVNSGRLSVPALLAHSALNTPATDDFAAGQAPGSPLSDAPLQCLDAQGQPVDSWLLNQVGGRFTLLLFVAAPDALDDRNRQAVAELAAGPVPVRTLLVTKGPLIAGAAQDAVFDIHGLVCERLDGRAATAYLLRPDQHVAARWRTLDIPAVQAALRRACAQT